MRVALIAGSGSGVWDERQKAIAMLGPVAHHREHIAINAAGTVHPDPLHHWASMHIDQLYEEPWQWAARREANGLETRYTRWATSKGGNVDRVTKLWKGGSSGLLAVAVALDGLGCDVAVLCGVPMDDRENEFTGRPWGDYARFRPSWEKHSPAFGDRVRSMSGWTKELLGEPSVQWLRAVGRSAA